MRDAFLNSLLAARDMTSVMTSVAAYAADMHAIVFNIIIFGSRQGIIETACLTCRESVTITLKSYNMFTTTSTFTSPSSWAEFSQS